MAIVEEARQAGVYRVAARFVDAALRRNGSLHDTSRVWSADTVAALNARFEERLGASGQSFDERWAGLLDAAPDEVVRLAAETMHVHVIFAADLAAATKRRLVHGTLARLEQPPRVATWMEAAFDGGVARTGVAFKTTRLSQLRFLATAVLAWKRIAAKDRRTLLTDAVAFKSWLVSVPLAGGQAQREALLHLVLPEWFEPIVSTGVKRRIVDAFANHVPEGIEDVDLALRSIRRALEPLHGPGFWFTDPGLAARWRA